MIIEQISEAIARLNTQHEQKKTRVEMLMQLISEKKEKQQQLRENSSLLEQVRVFLQELAEVTRNEITSGLESVVTLCLQHVFGPDIEFSIEVGTLRNSTSIEFFVISKEGNSEVKLKPEDTMGGGVIDTISIGLRFGLLKVLNPIPCGPIILDEPAKMVSADKIDSIGLLIKDLSKIFNKQVLMVTHHHQLSDIANHSVMVSKENGSSQVKGGAN